MTEAVALDVLRGGDTVDLRKARGAFFTPGAIVDFITQWAIDETTEAVLEPAAGEAAFLLSAATRAQAVGGSMDVSTTPEFKVQVVLPTAVQPEDEIHEDPAC